MCKVCYASTCKSTSGKDAWRWHLPMNSSSGVADPHAEYHTHQNLVGASKNFST